MPKQVTPALFDHCVKVYNAMQLSAERGEEDYFIYTGALTGLFSDLGLGQPYYTQVMKRLQAMGCVKQLQRGGGKMLSKWALIGAPTMTSFDAASGKVSSNASVLREEIMQLNRDLAQRVSRLESELTRLNDLTGLQAAKITKLEEQVATLIERSNVVTS